MLYAALAIFAALIVAADQLTKFLTVANIPMGTQIPVIPWLFQLTYIKNTGMAFSMLEGGRWFFFVVTVAALILIVFAIKKKWVNHPTGLWALAAIGGGAIGNLIDRVRLGYVIDMIDVTFMKFAVFNVADCFVVCGAILLCIYAFFFDKPQKGEHHDTDG